MGHYGRSILPKKNNISSLALVVLKTLYKVEGKVHKDRQKYTVTDIERV